MHRFFRISSAARCSSCVVTVTLCSFTGVWSAEICMLSIVVTSVCNGGDVPIEVVGAAGAENELPPWLPMICGVGPAVLKDIAVPVGSSTAFSSTAAVFAAGTTTVATTGVSMGGSCTSFDSGAGVGAGAGLGLKIKSPSLDMPSSKGRLCPFSSSASARSSSKSPRSKQWSHGTPKSCNRTFSSLIEAAFIAGVAFFGCGPDASVERTAPAASSLLSVFSLSLSLSLSSSTSRSASTSSCLSMMSLASGRILTSLRFNSKAGLCINMALCRILLNFNAPKADFNAAMRASQNPSGFSQKSFKLTGRTGPSSLARLNSAKTPESTIRTTPASSLAPSSLQVITKARRHCWKDRACSARSSQYLNQLSWEMTRSGTANRLFPVSVRSEGKLYKTNCNKPRAGFSNSCNVIRPVLSGSHCSQSSPSSEAARRSGSTGKVAANASTTSTFSKA
mmetsp:Transcript_18100/g.41972  ORF Transcript_18100/g.41972 Transcript_18100/m.41972 type:complete len:450 (-) Transcript_18100:316-1665(-)